MMALMCWPLASWSLSTSLTCTISIRRLVRSSSFEPLPPSLMMLGRIQTGGTSMCVINMSSGRPESAFMFSSSQSSAVMARKRFHTRSGSRSSCARLMCVCSSSLNLSAFWNDARKASVSPEPLLWSYLKCTSFRVPTFFTEPEQPNQSINPHTQQAISLSLSLALVPFLAAQ